MEEIVESVAVVLTFGRTPIPASEKLPTIIVHRMHARKNLVRPSDEQKRGQGTQKDRLCFHTRRSIPQHSFQPTSALVLSFSSNTQDLSHSCNHASAYLLPVLVEASTLFLVILAMPVEHKGTVENSNKSFKLIRRLKTKGLTPWVEIAQYDQAIPGYGLGGGAKVADPPAEEGDNTAI